MVKIRGMGLHYLENKGIVFKARWIVRPNINTDATIIFAWNDSLYRAVQTIAL